MLPRGIHVIWPYLSSGQADCLGPILFKQNSIFSALSYVIFEIMYIQSVPVTSQYNRRVYKDFHVSSSFIDPWPAKGSTLAGCAQHGGYSFLAWK